MCQDCVDLSTKLNGVFLKQLKLRITEFFATFFLFYITESQYLKVSVLYSLVIFSPKINLYKGEID